MLGLSSPGGFAVWDDGTRIRSQRFGFDGSLAAGADPEGRVVVPEFGGPSGPRWAVDASLGRFAVAWNDYVNENDVLAERLRMRAFDEEGQPLPAWPEPLLMSFVLPGSPLTGVSLVGMGSPDVWLAYTTRSTQIPGEPSEATALRTGIDLSPAPMDRVAFNEIYGRASITRLHTLAANPFNRFVQFDDGTLNRLGHDNRLELAISPAVLLPGTLAADGAGGLYGVEVSRSRLVVRRVDFAGRTSPGWPVAGVEFSVRPEQTLGVQLSTVREGGLMIAWVDAHHGELRVVMLTPEGQLAPGWPRRGRSVAEPRRAIQEFALQAIDPASALVAWTDARAGRSEVFLQTVRVHGESARFEHEDLASDPLAGTGMTALEPPVRTLSLRMSGLARSGASLPLEGWLPGSGPAVLEVVDLAGRRLQRTRLAATSGAFTHTLDMRDLHQGLYWARVTQGSRQSVLRIARLD